MKANNYLPSLNGIRAISIILVITYHYCLTNNLTLPLPISILADGQLGVNIFFVLSGFLITRILLLEETENCKISIKKFYYRRAFRILPAFYFLLFIYAVLQMFSILHFSFQSWLSSILYIKYINRHLDWESRHFWSLSIEENFYLIYPFLFYLTIGKRKKVLIYIIIVVALARGIGFEFAKKFEFDYEYFKLHPIFRIDALCIGALFAFNEKKIVLFLSQISIGKVNLLLITLSLLILFAKLPGINKHFLHLESNFILESLFSSIGTVTNFTIGLVLILSIHTPESLWYKFINLKIVDSLGKISYSLYLWQQLFFSSKVGVFAYFPFSILSLLCISILSFRYIEKPFLKLKHKLSTPIPDSFTANN